MRKKGKKRKKEKRAAFDVARISGGVMSFEHFFIFPEVRDELVGGFLRSLAVLYFARHVFVPACLV